MGTCKKGIILAGGSGSRLYPLTKVLNKHLLPVGGKPMIYYPLTTLMLGGIREILLISSSRHLPLFEELLGDGSQWGIHIQYAHQDEPEGLPQAFLIGADFIGSEPVSLILGDNLFHGQGLSNIVADAAQNVTGATIFAYAVRNPSTYGVVSFDESGRVIDIKEKPTNPKSDYAIPGLYFYGEDVVEVARTLKPSARNELEIVDLIRVYLSRGTLEVHKLRRGIAWFDAGTPGSLGHSSAYIDAIELRQGIGVACPEEVAFQMRFIDRRQLDALIEPISDSFYGEFLRHILS